MLEYCGAIVTEVYDSSFTWCTYYGMTRRMPFCAFGQSDGALERHDGYSPEPEVRGAHNRTGSFPE